MRKSEDSWADVAVVGGGVAGLAVARELGRRGLSVVVYDASRDRGPASNAAAGMLAPQAEADRADEMFELLCASRDMYPAFAASLREESGVDIELDQTGTLYLAFTEEDEREAAKRFEWQTRAGLSVERLTADEARALEPRISPRVRSALRFPRDWQVENRKLVRALRASAESFGVRVVEGAEALGVYVSHEGRASGVITSGPSVKVGGCALAQRQLSATPLWSGPSVLIRSARRRLYKVSASVYRRQLTYIFARVSRVSPTSSSSGPSAFSRIARLRL